MKPPVKTIVSAAAILGLFSVLGTGLVSLVHENTRTRIAENQRQSLLHSLQNLVPAEDYDNDILADAIEVGDPELGTKPVAVYRARKSGQAVAAVLSPTAPDGYNGEIRLLVAIKADESLAGVRVLAHKETPGLGDPIDENKSPWILGFTGLSLNNPPEIAWKVKRDGGAFDQFTGATITPRAVVNAVRKTLAYFAANKAALFSQQAQSGVDSPVEDE
ncbi:MAG: electron transport complex subunit RsxG [Methylococcaceae bacterium]|nr:electron transport complex subunit RsxG [Methylococcaceae bacterium]